MDYIGGMLNPIGKMPKTHYKKEFCNGFTGQKLMVHSGILMENIGISVIVIILFSRGLWHQYHVSKHVTALRNIELA